LNLDEVQQDKYTIPHPDGDLNINAPNVFDTSKPLRLKGKGFPEVQGYAKGDQLIHVNIWTPQEVSEEEKIALNKMQESENFKPKPVKGDKSFYDKVKEAFK
jgi:molecular chaperone DnaJ